jgi:hypothetical protein
MGDPLTTPAAKLSAVTRADVKAFIEEAESILARVGKRAGRLVQAEANALERKPSPHLRAEDPASLREALQNIPNDDEDYDSWVRIGLAIKGALGESGVDDWMSWSSKSTKDVPKTTETAWRTFRPTKIGAGTIYFHAERNGWKRTNRGIQLQRASDIEMEPVSWLWPGWLAAGKLHLLAGAPGAGKTTITLSLAATITRGGRWPDQTSCERPGNVVIWSGEDDPADTLVPRLSAMGADLERIHFVGSVIGSGGTRPFDPALDVLALIEKARELDNVRLFIVDPVVTAISGDSHKNAEVRRGLAPLVALAEGLNAAVIGITHFSKGTQGREPIDRLTGSLAFGAAARLVFAASKVTHEAGLDSEKRVFVRVKSNIGPDGDALTYALETVELPKHIVTSRVGWGEAIRGSARTILAEAEGGDEDEGSRSAVDEAKDFLIRELADGPVSPRDLEEHADQAGIAWATIRRAKTALGIETHKAGMEAGWMWQLPPKALKSSEDAQQNS